jgi:hypothetical protein
VVLVAATVVVADVEVVVVAIFVLPANAIGFGGEGEESLTVASMLVGNKDKHAATINDITTLVATEDLNDEKEDTHISYFTIVLEW